MNIIKALITGASSGLGYDMAIILSNMGYDLILVARREDKLIELKNKISTNVKIICKDLSQENSCNELFDEVKNESIDVLINNAGFGTYGAFSASDLKNELNMIDLNIKGVHILTKLFLKQFIEKDSGYILNVASSAGFMPGPLMSVYYASKAYVLNLTQAIYEELRQKKSNVHISALCPGPVDTEFNTVAKLTLGVKGLKSIDVSNYAIKMMFKKKLIIIPGLVMKLSLFGTRFASRKLLLKIVYKLQTEKDKI